MESKDKISQFLSGEEKQYKIYAVDEGLPIWLTQILISTSSQTLTIEKNDNDLEILEADAKTRLRTQIAVNEETQGIAIICENPLGSIKVQDLLTVGGQTIISIPDQFTFLQQAAASLDSAFSYIMYSGVNEMCLESCFIGYSKSITILPEILELSQVMMTIMKLDNAFSYSLRGDFCIGDTINLIAKVEFGMAQEITIDILSKDDTFPSLFDFIKWLTKETGMSELISWLPDSQNLLDAALCGARIMLDGNDGSMEDFRAEVALTLWHMEFIVDFDWADKTIDGALKENTSVKISTLLADLSGKAANVESSVADLELEDCTIKLDFESRTYELGCYISTDWSVGPLVLKNVQMSIQYQKENGLSWKLSGNIDLGGGKIMMAGASYDAEKEDWIISASVGMGLGVTILDLLGALKKISPGLSLPEFLGGISLQEFEMEYHSAESHCKVSFKGEAKLKDAVSLTKIPLLTQVLPQEIIYEDEGIRIVYKNGSITEGKIDLAYSNEKPDEKFSEESDGESGGESSENPQEEKQLPAAETGEQTGALSEEQGIRWFEVHKKIGTASLDRVGLAMENGILRVLFDAGLKMGPVSTEVLGLTVGYDINKNSVTGDIRGMDLSYSTEAFTLEGGIYKEVITDPDIALKLGGTLTIKAAGWKLMGMASYALLADHSSSLFVFLNCQFHLGGTPAFQLTGMMGGLGINRKLRIPQADQLETFPLLSMDAKKTGMQILSELEASDSQKKPWLEIRKGDYMAAVGVEFTSFEILHGKLLLTLLFGSELQAALLGSGEMTFPKGAKKEKAYAYLKILMAAVLKPEQGTFTLDAVVSNDSFLLSKDCHLTGGAAFYTWYGTNPHAGDFVVTVGGYHPAFQPPSHYPKPARVGFSWQVSSCISAKGEAYLAVTPSCAMAGGNLEFVFEKGNLRAWFTAHADLIMQWHPFFFEAAIGVEVGASYRMNLLFCHKTIKVTLGAALQLWGPPIGGIVTVNLYVLSFDVSFGQGKDSSGRVLDWKGFREVLPSAEEIEHFLPTDGLTPQEAKEEPWVADTMEFAFDIETTIPVGEIGIRPMGLSKVMSESSITVTSPQKEKGTLEQFGFGRQEILGNFPEALWGSPLTGTGRPQANMLENRVKGYHISSPRAVAGRIKDIEDYKEALITCAKLPNPLALSNEESGRFSPAADENALVNIERIARDEEKARRKTTVEQLQAFYQGPAGDFDAMEKNLYSIFRDQPMIVHL